MKIIAPSAAILATLALLAGTVEAQEAPAVSPDPTVTGDPRTNAGAAPMTDDAVFKAFHGRAGVERVINDTIDHSMADPRISDIFKGHDIPRLKRTLTEQVCYLIGGGCVYSGKDMKTAHKDMGLQTSDMNALVEDLQWAMDKEGVPFHAQNRLLAKLAPMKRMSVTR
jgi:hemoglobin